MTWLICNNADIEKAKEVNQFHRSYLIEFQDTFVEKSWLQFLEETPPPRIIRTHLKPYMFANQLETVQFKTIVVMRNLKDVLVSCFLMYGKLCDLKVSWDEFFEMFKQGELPYGSWVDHCLAWWKLRDQPRILILKYEEIKKNPEDAIRRIAQFCGKQLNDDQLTAICDHTTLSNMQNLASITPDGTHESRKDFFRKGIVGDWKQYFNEDQKNYVSQLLKSTTEKEGLFFEDT